VVHLTGDWQPAAPCPSLLTADECRLLEATAEVARLLHRVILADDEASGRPADESQAVLDGAELVSHLHVVQRAVGAQAAARAYPTQLRLLGRRLPS
jgi:hypothetical protein